MMNKLYMWLGYLNHLLYYSILWFFVGGICTIQLLSDTWSSFSYVGTLLFFIICLWSKRLTKGKRVLLLLVCSLCLTFGFGLSSWYVVVAGIVYYGIGGYFYLKVSHQDLNLSDLVKIVGIILLYASLLGYFVNDTNIYQTISSGGLFFILYSVVHVIRTNVITEYEHNTSETIQKEKNIIIVNIVAMLAMVLCFFIRNHVIDIFLVVVFGVCFLFYVLLKVLGYFVGSIFNGILWFLQLVFGYEVPKAEQTEEATTIIETILTEEEVEMITSNDSWILIIGIIILVIVAIFIVRKVYRALGSKESVEGTSEEKEFIFQSSDFLKPWKDKVKQLVAYGSLSKTRRKYIQTVNHCIKEGYQWKNSFTPNDYLRSVDRKTVVSKYNLEEVTKQYNEERYK